MKSAIIMLLLFISFFQGCFESGYERLQRLKNKKIQQKFFSQDMKRFNRLYSYKHICRGQVEVSSKASSDSLGNLTSCEVTGKLLMDSLAKFKYLSDLSVICNDYTSEPIFRFECESLSKLNRLSFISCAFPRQIIIKHSKKLTSIRIYADKDNTNVESVEVSDPTSIKSFSINNVKLNKIPEIIKKMTNLERLNLSSNNITKINFNDFPKNLKPLRLILDNNNISEINLDSLPKNLEFISLQKNPIIERGRETLGKKLKERNIDLWGYSGNE